MGFNSAFKGLTKIVEVNCSPEGNTVVQNAGCCNMPHAVAIVRTHRNLYHATTTLSPGAVTHTLSGDKAAVCSDIFVRTETERFWMKRSSRCNPCRYVSPCQLCEHRSHTPSTRLWTSSLYSGCVRNG